MGKESWGAGGGAAGSAPREFSREWLGGVSLHFASGNMRSAAVAVAGLSYAPGGGVGILPANSPQSYTLCTLLMYTEKYMRLAHEDEESATTFRYIQKNYSRSL